MKAHKNETISLQAAGSPASVPLKVRAVCPGERERFDRLLGKHHYLGVCPSVGDFLRQVVWRGDQWVALLVWGPSALKLKDRERWIGWNAGMASERLKLVVQNRRYLLLHARGAGKDSRRAAGSRTRRRTGRPRSRRAAPEPGSTPKPS